MLPSRITRLAPRAASVVTRTTTTTPRATYQLQQARNAGTAGGRSEPDMGGPGGQEAYPFTNKKHRKYATQTAVASVAALGALYFFLGGKESKDSTKTTTSTGADKGQAGTNPNGQAMDKVEKFGRSRN